MRGNERGFTLIELLAAGVIIVALLVTSLFLLRPDDYSTMRQNAKRRTDVASLVQAINRYTADTGESLPNVPQKLTAVSSVDGHYDLCKYLVPKYLKDIPLDPLVGLKTKDSLPTRDKCNDGVTYASGYGILRDKDGRIFISAPVAEGDSGEVIELPVPLPKQ
jgi:type II secretory pathway pseudopilin PulG